MKIMTISDSPTLFSGLARVHRHIVDAFTKEGHQVLCCGWFAYDDIQMEKAKSGKQVDPVYYEGPHGKTRVMCVPKKNGMRDMYAIYDIIDHFKPDIVMTIGDHWDFWYMRAIKVKTSFSFQWIPYLTVEHDDIEKKWVSLLRYADAVVVPSQFGKNVLDAHLQTESILIPYGVEKAFQRPSKQHRSTLRMERGCENKVRFITVAQNTFRKNLPALIQAVKTIAPKDPDHMMQFYVHTNVDHSGQEEYLYDLKGLIDMMGVSDWFIFPTGDEMFSVLDSPQDSYMSDEYGASDFFVLPSTAEGYGLPACEAMACGVPVISNSCSTMPDHLGAQKGQMYGWTKRGRLVENKKEIYPPCRILNVINPEALGQAILEAFQLTQTSGGRKRLEVMSLKCEKYGKGKTWENMQLDLCNVILSIAGKTKVTVEEL